MTVSLSTCGRDTSWMWQLGARVHKGIGRVMLITKRMIFGYIWGTVLESIGKQNKTNDTRGDKCHSVIYLEAIEPKRTCVALEPQSCHLFDEEGLLLFGKSCFSLSRTFRLSGPVFIYLEPALDLLISTSMGFIPWTMSEISPFSGVKNYRFTIWRNLIKFDKSS